MSSMVHAVRALLSVCLVFCFTLGAAAAPPPIMDFVEANGIDDIAISPDGAYLAAVHHHDTNQHIRQLHVFKIVNGKPVFYKGGEFENMHIHNLAWVNDNRLVVTLREYDPDTFEVYSINGLGYKFRAERMMAMDADLTNQTTLLAGDRTFKNTLNKATVKDFLFDDPKHIIMQIRDSSSQVGGLNLYKVDVYSGKSDVIEKGRSYTFNWLLDGKAQPRGRIDMDNDYTTYLVRRTPNDNWVEVEKYPTREEPKIWPRGFSETDPNIIYVYARQGSDTLGLYEFNIQERKVGRKVFVHPKYDMSGLATSRDRRLVGFRYVAHKPEIVFIDKKLEALQKKFDETFAPEDYVGISSRTRDDSMLVLRVTGPKKPGLYFLYNVKANRASLIGVESKRLATAKLGTMKPITYKARDGLEIDAYLTMPPGNPARPPLVVMPHGGPEARDSLTWDPWVQFFATRGYAVLQPNFRGSDGYGRKFLEAGRGEWGGKTQDDITDGVRHVIEKGLVDPQRICIMGASYGGFAALAGVAFTPDLYKCAISMNGVSDLPAAMREENRRGISYYYWKKLIGDLLKEKDVARMKERSPIEAVDRIKVPILLLAGEKDGIVDVEQSRRMASKLKSKGKPHTYIEFEDEQHSFFKPESRTRMYKEMEKFLAKYLGGYTSTASKSAAH